MPLLSRMTCNLLSAAVAGVFLAGCHYHGHHYHHDHHHQPHPPGHHKHSFNDGGSDELPGDAWQRADAHEKLVRTSRVRA